MNHVQGLVFPSGGSCILYLTWIAPAWSHGACVGNTIFAISSSTTLPFRAIPSREQHLKPIYHFTSNALVIGFGSAELIVMAGVYKSRRNEGQLVLVAVHMFDERQCNKGAPILKAHAWILQGCYLPMFSVTFFLCSFAGSPRQFIMGNEPTMSEETAASDWGWQGEQVAWQLWPCPLWRPMKRVHCCCYMR